MNTHHTLGRCACHRHARPGVLTISNGAASMGGAATVPRDGALPDTPAARAAEAYLAEVSNLTMVRHCKRTFRFGQALAEKAGARPDLEMLYVGALFHDLGLEPLFAGPDEFESLGAREAERFLNAQGYARIAQQVAAAIELHTSPDTANDPRPEVAYLCMGALCDVVGARLDQLEPRLIQQVVAEYPREGTKALLTALLKIQIDTKPASRIAVAQARMGVLQRIADAPFSG
ncbi:HD domain-containing protein [Phenylobacterium sp.]|uniref:HD domain-containing protein n=1 Tax=Phenylobacterium sp. TaxID=1871053 RepID=UPI0030F436FD